MARFSKTLRQALVATTLAAGATTAIGQTAAPEAPPAADASPEQLKAWVDRNIVKDGFVEAAVDANRVILYDPKSLERLADGHVLVQVRAELFRPRLAHGQSLRSDKKKLEIDCVARRYRILEIQGYAAPNMQQPAPLDPVSSNWTAPLAADSSAWKVNQRACDEAPAK